MSYSPVILFVYNRIDHTKKTIKCLANNALATQTELFIFSDAPKNKDSEGKVNEVRQFIHSEYVSNAFQKVTIFEADSNKGLARSIIDGVSNVMADYGKVIVIEDDNESTPDFLNFMNDCLDFYKNNKMIWSIGGFSCVKNFPIDYKKDVFLMGRTCSYAWATWQDRWELVDWDVKDYLKFRFNIAARQKFNRYGNDRSNMLDLQMHNKINSWAIRFCYSAFKHGMYTVYPCVTKISNIGHDGSGTHFNEKNKCNENFEVSLAAGVEPYVLTDSILVDERIRKEFVKGFNEPAWKCVKRYLGSFVKYGI